MDHDHQSHQVAYENSIFKWTFIGFLIVAGYFLVTEHRAHLGGVLNYLPLLLLAACPLMHLFMHHGHHGHDGHSEQLPPQDDRGEKK
jgi:hypothetical protein